MKTRIKYYDIAKAVGMYAIIFGHHGPASYLAVCGYHVPLFFFISGFFISTKKDITIYAKEKMRQLGLPYLVACILYLLVDIIYRFWGPDRIDMIMFIDWLKSVVYGSGSIELMNPIHVKPIGAIWFLLALFWGIIITRIAISSKYGGILVVVSVAAGLLMKDTIWLPLAINPGLVSAGYIYAGYLFYKYVYPKYENRTILKTNKLLDGILGIGLWIAYLSLKPFQGYTNVNCNLYENGIIVGGGLAIVATLAVIMISRGILQYIPVVNDILLFVGRNTLLILCVHFLDLHFIDWNYVLSRMIFPEKINVYIISALQLGIYTIIIYVYQLLRNREK